ncbi:MAG: hypothetical protein M3Q48_14800 [Actinomycetota bacterium]|nr:hypothetical protein [Actinomycetota bacterium]
MSPPACAAPSCPNPVPRRSGPGRPARYCSPECRPSPRRPNILVEVDHPEISPDGRPAARVWSVRLRRGRRVVVIADDLGWPSAKALAGALNDLLRPGSAQKGGTIE